MSFLESVGTMFKKPDGQQQPQGMNGQPMQRQNPQNGQGSQQGQQQQTQQSNPGALPGQNAGQEGEADPWKPYAKMWDTPTEGDKAPSFTLKPEDLKGVADQRDFTKGMPPELLARVQSGDGSAFVEALQHVGRSVYSTSLDDASKLTGTFFDAREKHNDKGFGQKVKNELVNDQFSEVQGSNNPVVKQQLSQVAKGLQQQHPDASPKEIKQMTIDYVKNLHSAVFPQTQSQQEGNGQSADTDFEKWFNE